MSEFPPRDLDPLFLEPFRFAGGGFPASLRLRVEGVGFRVKSVGFRVKGVGFRVEC